MPCLHYLHSYVSIITHLVGISNFCTQILMNARQHKLGTANIGVEIHWAHTNSTAMKGIHWKRMNAKVSYIHIQLTEFPVSLFYAFIYIASGLL